jgi:AmmeMemoRadiSam system protein A
MGNTEARYALAKDIARNAISAASRDFRFAPVTADELSAVRLEVTILTKPAPLPYHNYDELVRKLKPGVDGVILTSENRKGLLLPQVWDRLPDADRFLEMIALKAGFPAGDLRDTPPSVVVYTFGAHHYSELGYLEPGS